MSMHGQPMQQNYSLHLVLYKHLVAGILNLFQKTSSCHSYKTRTWASGNSYVNSSDLESYKMSFSRFGAIKLWNEIPCHIRHLPKNKFKKTLFKLGFDILSSEDDYIDIPTSIKKVNLALKKNKNKCLLISFYFYNLRYLFNSFFC